jgi:hypothetical protein
MIVVTSTVRKYIRYLVAYVTSFNQNLCPWGAKLPTAFTYGGLPASNGDMFRFSGCPNKDSPAGPSGPWCAVTNCTANP